MKSVLQETLFSDEHTFHIFIMPIFKTLDKGLCVITLKYYWVCFTWLFP